MTYPPYPPCHTCHTDKTPSLLRRHSAISAPISDSTHRHDGVPVLPLALLLSCSLSESIYHPPPPLLPSPPLSAPPSHTPSHSPIHPTILLLLLPLPSSRYDKHTKKATMLLLTQLQNPVLVVYSVFIASLAALSLLCAAAKKLGEDLKIKPPASNRV
ncbi:hypothetical protein BZA05DRAFT_206688 [Tricharina praecox]|uniref:uncharacterized protein n=1 Tax=Tricharina praecox TaxID=43433 RepID=UPI002220A665|nr:uncharacterized protein BZA05DRAFT_206688 [Tricharina praecox]KAI5842247.1 hypothetical protein BZA05DRAFT_206688 [Tricharina praecox]